MSVHPSSRFLSSVLMAITLGWWSVVLHAATPQLAAGEAHSVALHSDGTVYAWGDNTFGQLGNGQAGEGLFSARPVKVQGLNDIVAIAARANHTLALRADGTVWGWGENTWGVLGDGTQTHRSVPVQVRDLTGIAAIATGHFHSFAVRSDGTLWVWGLGDYGRFGNGREGWGEWSAVPIQVRALSNVIAAAAGYAESFAITSDGRLWAWGNNREGQLGLGQPTAIETLPVQVAGLSELGVQRVEANEWHVIAQTRDGRLWAWGRNNDYGQLGNGTLQPSAAPVPVSPTYDATPIDFYLGNLHSLARLANGKLAVWGNNWHGQLGINRSDIGYLAEPVMLWNNTTTGEINPIRAIAAGSYHNLAMDSDGFVHAWGKGEKGRLGLGETNLGDVYTPYPVLAAAGNGYLNLYQTQPTEAVLTVRITGSGQVHEQSGRIACPEVCEAIFGFGETVRLSAVPEIGWEFAGWGGACTGTLDCVLTLEGPTEVVANFTQASNRYQLDAPINGTFESGIGVVHGWVCEASRINIQVDDFTPFAAAYGAARPDSQMVCGDINNGFAAAINWAEYGDGPHTLKLLADGRLLTQVQVTVTTLGARFLTGLQASTGVMDFPQAGLSTRLVWSEPYQNFVVAPETSAQALDLALAAADQTGYWESPLAGGFESGQGIIRGWFCNATQVSLDLDGIRIDLPYGSDRPDTQSVCGDTNNGFAAAINWNLYPDGLHRATLYKDGVAVESRTFTTATPAGLGYISGIQLRLPVSNFPYPGDQLTLQWSEPHQNFRMISYTPAQNRYEQQVFTLFIGYFGRPPAPAGLSYYNQQMAQSNGNWRIIADDFWNSVESQTLYPPELPIRDRINKIYNNLFARNAAPAGLDYWEGLITAGIVSLPEMAYTIAYNASPADTAVLNAKRETARLWTQGLDTPEEQSAFATAAGRQIARDFLASINSPIPASQTAVDQAIAQMVAQVGGGRSLP